MNDWLAQQIQNVFQLARMDFEYAQMQIQYKEQERSVSEWLQTQPEEIQDTFWEFICLSDAMNWRVLELVLGGFPLQGSDNTDSSDT